MNPAWFRKNNRGSPGSRCAAATRAQGGDWTRLPGRCPWLGTEVIGDGWRSSGYCTRGLGRSRRGCLNRHQPVRPRDGPPSRPVQPVDKEAGARSRSSVLVRGGPRQGFSREPLIGTRAPRSGASAIQAGLWAADSRTVVHAGLPVCLGGLVDLPGLAAEPKRYDQVQAGDQDARDCQIVDDHGYSSALLGHVPEILYILENTNTQSTLFSRFGCRLMRGATPDARPAE